MKHSHVFTLIFAATAYFSGAALAQQIQEDGTMLVGGMRLNPEAPPVSSQRKECKSLANQLAGILAMRFVGVEPWVTNHPNLERNCATLLDIPPVAQAPHIPELRGSTGGWWSRVTRVKLPENQQGWREGFGFGWCSNQDCDRQLLLLFTQTELIGFCSAYPGEGTRYALASTDEATAWTYVAGYQPCLADPRKTVSAIAGADRRKGNRKFTLPRIMAGFGNNSSNTDIDTQVTIYRNNRAQLDQDLARRQAEEERAARAFERLRQPNELGW